MISSGFILIIVVATKTTEPSKHYEFFNVPHLFAGLSFPLAQEWPYLGSVHNVSIGGSGQKFTIYWFLKLILTAESEILGKFWEHGTFDPPKNSYTFFTCFSTFQDFIKNILAWNFSKRV